MSGGERQAIPSKLAYELEDGTYLGSCDWGYCNRDQVGWGSCDEDVDGPVWLAICGPCSRGDFDPRKAEVHAVDHFISFDDVRAMWAATSGGGEHDER